MERLSNIAGSIESVANFLKMIASYFYQILGALFYMGKTLIIGVGKLISYVFSGEVFTTVAGTLSDLSVYIGGPATVFISALLFVIIVRILIAFLFKILRMNIDYNSLQMKTMNNNKSLIGRRHNLFK